MEKGIFRSKMIDRVRSPEQLNDYIRVSSPSVWVVLIAILVLLAALFTWSAMATIEETVEVTAACDGDALVFFVAADDASNYKAGMTVRLPDGGVGTIRAVDAQNVLNAEAAGALLGNDFLAYSLSLPPWCVRVTCDVAGALPQGVAFPATVVTGKVKPLSFFSGTEE